MSGGAFAIEVFAGGFQFYAAQSFILLASVSTIYGTADPIPYTDDEIDELQFTQLADVLFIAHPNHPTATLTYHNGFDWRYEQPTFEEGPYIDTEAGDEDISLTAHTVVNRVTLKSTANDFAGAVEDSTLVEYSYNGQKVLGLVKTATSDTEVVVEPYEDRSLVLSKEVYSPGLYDGWDGTNSVPTYDTTITGTGVSVAFSNTGVVTQECIGNYIRFCDKSGDYYWMSVSGIGDIVQQAAYGIIATGDILTVVKPTGTVTRRNHTITAKLLSSAATFFDLSTDIGRLFRLVLGGKVVHARGEESGSNTTQEIAVTLSRSLPRSVEGLAVVENGTTNDWRRGSWFIGNYPATVCFHEGRLGFASTDLEPQTGWLSKVNDLYTFATTDEEQRVLDDSAITFTLASDTANKILWMISRNGAMVLGTTTNEWLISAGDRRGGITPTNISAQPQSSYGSAAVKPLSVGKSILYLQQGSRKLRQMNYDYQTDSQVSLDLTVFAEHIFKDYGGARQFTYQHLPESALYVLLGNGQVAVLTYEPDQQVYAWSRIILGGTDAAVESIASVKEDDRYVLYMVVGRTINGTFVRTIEVMEPEFRPDSSTDRTDMKFFDSYRTFSGPITNITGLTHLAGEEVAALVDDQVHQNLTVSATGTLTLPAAAVTAAYIGVPFTSLVKTFPLEAPAQFGTGQGQPKRIDHLTLRLLNSIDFKHGKTEDSLYSENFRVATDSVNATPPMFSGDKRVTFVSGADVRAQIVIVQDKPLPLTILSVIPEVTQHK